MIKKTGDKVIKKTLKEKVIKKYLHQIQSLEQDYEEIVQKEAVERTLRKADQEAQKAMNMMEYKDEIMNRPKRSEPLFREWIMTQQDKEKINMMQRKELGLDEEATQHLSIQKKRTNLKSPNPIKKVKR